jgi:uncharacterized cupin superfamily protein
MRLLEATVTSSHHIDTGDDPTRQDAAAAARTASPPALTWETYQAHRRGCNKCQTSVWRCTEGDELWNAYLKAAS